MADYELTSVASGAALDTAIGLAQTALQPTLTAAINGAGYEIGRNLSRVVTASGTLTAADHSGCTVVTSGNITVPTTAGFHAVIIAGGAHTVSFNSATSAAMAAGDLMTIFVQSATVIHAVKTLASNKVTFS